MKFTARLLIATTLLLASGCAKTDWIDRTLVTVDVSGTWYGGSPGSSTTREIWLELEQQGPVVKGSMRLKMVGGTGDVSGPIEGTVAGDVFSFRNTRATVEGKLTVTGEEMDGLASTSFGPGRFSLRRFAPSPSNPPPR